MEKFCIGCEQTLSVQDFSKRASSKDGLQTRCKVCQRAQVKAWREANPGHKRRVNLEVQKAWKAKNADRIRGYNTKWRGLNPDKANAHWCTRNKDRQLAARQKYNHTTHGRLSKAIHTQNRRARLRAIGGKITAAEFKVIVEQQNNICCYCKAPFTNTLKPTVEHVIPLARGGQHAIGNIAAACKSCNSIKQARTVEEWLGAA